MKNSNIIFYDGECGMCNKFIDYLLRIDKKKLFYYSPLNGVKAKLLLPPSLIENPTTVVFVKNEVIFLESNAVLEICKTLGGLWSIFYFFKILPEFFRNKIYEQISKNRIVWFGKNKSCRILSQLEKLQFLD